MADVEKPLEPFDQTAIDPMAAPEEVEVELPEEEGQEEYAAPEHGDNLAEYFEEDQLAEIADDLMEDFEADEMSRSDWLQTYADGLDYLGFTMDDRSQPFEGACGVFHPVLAEAVVRFQSNAIGEIFPAAGPVLTKIHGEETNDKMKQSKRVQEELNYQLTENMPEYRTETEQLLFRLPLAGSVFRKVYFDPMNQRPCSMMCPAEDVVVDYETSNPELGERLCHIMRKTPNEVRKLMRSGFYLSCKLPDPEPYDSMGRDKEAEFTGLKGSGRQDQRHVLLEFHVHYNLPGAFADPDDIADPYIITVDKTSRKVLSIYRNWKEQDEYRNPDQYFVHYQYMPGLGAYGFGLIHLLGSIAKASTSILRQLIDAGTLSNLPGGLKAKGLRVVGEDDPIAPGEWRDIETGGQPIKDSLFPLPYKEPSAVLAGLLDKLIEEGRRIGSIADVEISGTNQNAPVGTTLALLERSLKVMTAVHARLHASLKRELKLISAVINEYMPPNYEWDLEGQFDRQKDFDGRVDVIPVSDPNAATQAQRIVQLQAVQQLAAQAPELYNMKELHRVALQTIGIKNDERILPLDEDPPYLDPVQENMRVLTLQPIKVYPEQDHEAHIQTHMAAMTDPLMAQMIGQSPNAIKLQGQMEAHIAEHLGYKYRTEIERELGVQLPPMGESLPPELEARLSRLVAQAAEQLKERHKAEVEMMEAEEARKDPLIQLREREIAMKERESAAKTDLDRDKLIVDVAKAVSKEIMDMRRIESEEARAGAKIGADLITWGKELDSAERREGLKLGKEAADNIRQESLDRDSLAQEKALREKEIQAMQRRNNSNSGE